MAVLGVAGSQSIYGSGAYPARTGVAIPALWSNKLLVKFYESTVLAAISNTDYEGEIKKQGDTVHIQDIGAGVTISDHTKGAEITYEDLETTLVDLEIGYAKKFAFKIDDIDKVQTNVKLMDRWAEDASEKMKIAIDSQVLGIVHAQVAAANAGASAGAISGGFNLGNDTTSVTVDKTDILDLIVDLGTVLDEQNIPEQSRFLVLPAHLAGMIKKSDLKDASITGDGVSVLRNGRLGMIDRFTIYSSNLVDNTAGAKWKVLAGHPCALTFASQITQVQHIPVLESSFGSAMRGLNVYGFNVIKPEALACATVN